MGWNTDNDTHIYTLLVLYDKEGGNVPTHGTPLLGGDIVKMGWCIMCHYRQAVRCIPIEVPYGYGMIQPICADTYLGFR